MSNKKKLLIKKYLVGGYILPLNVLESIANGSAAGGLLQGFGKVMSKILPEWVLKAGTYVSPLNYAAAISKGSINPKVGEEVISKWHPNLLLVARTGEAVFGGKAIKNTPKAVVNTAAKAGNKTARAYLVSKELNKGIKLNTKNGRIEVTGNYFNSPDKWYRITERPEKIGIEEQGKNVTTADSPETYGTINGWRTSVLDNSIETGKGVNEGYFVKKPKKINLSLRRIHGRAHGNTSQAAKGQLWQANTAGSNIFPGGVIEGEAPLTIPYGLSRTHFVNTPWEEVPTGGRIGFHTGEMPMSNLGWFQKTNKGTYTYEPIIPEKRIFYNPTLLKEPPTSLKFFERKPSRITETEKAGVPKTERNLRLHGQPLAPYYDYSLINKHYEPWTVNEKGLFVFASPEKSKKLGTVHFSMNEPVMDHFMGSWGDAPTVTILPYRNMRSQTAPVDLAIMDTFFPNYNGLKVSSRGSKTLTGDKAIYKYYKSKGIDVEFSPEMEVLLQKLLKNKSKLEPLRTSPDFDYYSPKVQKLYEEQASLKEAIDQITRNWSRKHVKTIPSFDKLTEFGKAEGLNMDKYPYLLGTNGQWTTRASRELGLDYTWLSDPTNHAVFLLNPENALLKVQSGEYGNVRPEYVKYLKWVVDHKADYRKKGGKLCLIPRN